MSWWGDVWTRFSRQRIALVAGAVLALLLLIGALAPVLAPYDPTLQLRDTGLSEFGQPLPPNGTFWLGTDGLGRDVVSRIMYGERTSLTIGVAGAGTAIGIALLIGGLAAFLGGKADFALMRFVDLVMSVPTFFMMLLLIAMLKPGVWVVIVVIALFAWTYPARIFRSQILALKQREFVHAAEAMGATGPRIFFRHLIPHLLPLVVVYLALMIPSTIFAEAGLSYVGLGIPPPNPSLGSMINEGQQWYRTAPWIVLFPGLAILLTVVSFNLVGNALRDAMDPQRRRT